MRERSNDEVEARGKEKREGTRKSGSVERMNKARKGIKQKQERGTKERERGKNERRFLELHIIK